MSASRTDEEQQFYAAMTQNIGEAVLKMIPICDRLGWDSAAAALEYMHPTSIATGIFCDFVAWASGTGILEGATRLRDVAAAWGWDDAGLATQIPGPVEAPPLRGTGSIN